MLGKNRGKKLGEILVGNEVITKDQLKTGLETQKKEDGLLGEIFIRLGFVNELDIVQALSVQCGFPYLPLENYELKKELSKIVAENVARQYSLVPLDVIGDIITLVMVNPLDDTAIGEIETLTKKKVMVFISTISSVRDALEKLYKKEDEDEDEDEAENNLEVEEEATEVKEETERNQVAQEDSEKE